MKKQCTPVKFNAHFLLTNYCNSFCPHCLISAGPHNPKHFIDFKDIMFYLDEFDKDPNFCGGVGFNGGEIMTAYKHYSKDYIPDLIKECVNRDYHIDLRTNALWVEDNTINNVIWDSLDKINLTNYKNSLCFSLSIDKFHNNETANQKLISRICNSDLKKHFKLSAYLIPDNPNDDTDEDKIYDRLYNLLYKLSQNGIAVKEIPLKKVPERYNLGVYLNDVPLFVETHNIGRWGRARDFGIGNEDDINRHVAAQFNIIHKNNQNQINPNNCTKPNVDSMNIIFSYDGFIDFIVPVEKITPGVAYRDGKKCKPWAQLYPEMVSHLNTRFDALKQLYPDITKESVGLPVLLQKLNQR